MGTSALDWNDIPLLLALARAGSMSAAARELGVDVSTISRRVSAVEAAMGTRLFIRSNRGYEPTSAGAVFIERAARAAGEVQALQAETRAEGEGISGTVRITAVDALFDHWLVSRLPRLLQRHPGLDLQLVPDDHNLSFTRREADFALRVAQPTQDAALMMRKVASAGFAVYGVPALAESPREQWGAQPWLGYGDERAGLPESRWLAQLQPPPRRVVGVNSVSTLIAACEAGMGLALLPCIFADTRKALRRHGTAPELHREIWLLNHRDAAHIRRFRAVADWLAEQFEEDAARFAG